MREFAWYVFSVATRASSNHHIGWVVSTMRTAQFVPHLIQAHCYHALVAPIKEESLFSCHLNQATTCIVIFVY